MGRWERCSTLDITLGFKLEGALIYIERNKTICSVTTLRTTISTTHYLVKQTHLYIGGIFGIVCKPLVKVTLATILLSPFISIIGLLH